MLLTAVLLQVACADVNVRKCTPPLCPVLNFS